MKSFSRLVTVMIAAATLFAVSATSANAFSSSDVPALAARDYSQSQWPDEYAGFWVSYVTQPSFGDALPADAKFHFAFTDDAESKVATLRTMFPGIHDYVAVDHEYSLNELAVVRGLVATDIALIQAGTLAAPGGPFPFYSYGVSETANRVTLGVPDATPALQTWADGRWGPAVIVETVGPGGLDGPLLLDPGTLPGSEPDLTPGVPGAGDSLRRKKALVKKCNKAAKSRSAQRKRFSNSKKCKRARRAVRA